MFAGPQVWQDVPNAIKKYPKHTFKKAYTKFLLQSYKKKKNVVTTRPMPGRVVTEQGECCHIIFPAF